MSADARRELVRRMIAAELLARRGEGPLALRRPFAVPTEVSPPTDAPPPVREQER